MHCQGKRNGCVIMKSSKRHPHFLAPMYPPLLHRYRQHRPSHCTQLTKYRKDIHILRKKLKIYIFFRECSTPTPPTHRAQYEPARPGPKCQFRAKFGRFWEKNPRSTDLFRSICLPPLVRMQSACSQHVVRMKQS